jgi:hypothetical protein
MYIIEQPDASGGIDQGAFSRALLVLEIPGFTGSMQRTRKLDSAGKWVPCPRYLEINTEGELTLAQQAQYTPQIIEIAAEYREKYVADQSAMRASQGF